MYVFYIEKIIFGNHFPHEQIEGKNEDSKQLNQILSLLSHSIVIGANNNSLIAKSTLIGGQIYQSQYSQHALSYKTINQLHSLWNVQS